MLAQLNKEKPMTILRTIALATAVALTAPAVSHLSDVPKAAAAEPTDADMEILKQKIKADKKLVVAENMQLTEGEAQSFWPIYDEYQNGLAAINERLKKVILEYADAWNKRELTDATATKLRDEAIAIDEAEAKLKRDFAPRLDKAIGPIKAARYQQIENKIRALVKFELAKGIPLAE
jgi:hypothetical protein